MANPRRAKVGEQIKQIAASYLERRLKDPRLGFVTLTDVRMTGDGREATIFYTVYGSAEERADSAAALEDARGQIRSAVGRQLGLKFTPTIAFMLDAVPETAAEIEAVLERARGLDAEVAARAAGASYAGDADPYRHDDEDDADDVIEDGEDDLDDDLDEDAAGEAEAAASEAEGPVDLDDVEELEDRADADDVRLTQPGTAR